MISNSRFRESPRTQNKTYYSQRQLVNPEPLDESHPDQQLRRVQFVNEPVRQAPRLPVETSTHRLSQNVHYEPQGVVTTTRHEDTFHNSFAAPQTRTEVPKFEISKPQPQQHLQPYDYNYTNPRYSQDYFMETETPKMDANGFKNNIEHTHVTSTDKIEDVRLHYEDFIIQLQKENKDLKSLQNKYDDASEQRRRLEEEMARLRIELDMLKQNGSSGDNVLIDELRAKLYSLNNEKIDLAELLKIHQNDILNMQNKINFYYTNSTNEKTELQREIDELKRRLAEKEIFSREEMIRKETRMQDEVRTRDNTIHELRSKIAEGEQKNSTSLTSITNNNIVRRTIVPDRTSVSPRVVRTTVHRPVITETIVTQPAHCQCSKIGCNCQFCNNHISLRRDTEQVVTYPSITRAESSRVMVRPESTHRTVYRDNSTSYTVRPTTYTYAEPKDSSMRRSVTYRTTYGDNRTGSTPIYRQTNESTVINNEISNVSGNSGSRKVVRFDNGVTVIRSNRTEGSKIDTNRYSSEYN